MSKYSTGPIGFVTKINDCINKMKGGFNKARNNNAIKHYNSAKEQFKNYPFKIPNRNLAIQKLNQAIKLDPYFTDAYYLRGFAYLGIGEYVKAISDFDYVARTGSRTDYHALRGETYWALGMPKKAVIDAIVGIRTGNDRFSWYYILETNLPKINKGDLDILDKTELFNVIKNIQTPGTKILLLKQCLDKTTPGKSFLENRISLDRMWI